MTGQYVAPKKSRGRPVGSGSTGIGTSINVRLHDPLLANLDGWIASLPEPHPSRPEAIRSLVDAALKMMEKDSTS